VPRPRKLVPSVRFDLRCEADWLERVERQAKRRGLSTAAYIRQAVSAWVETDESSDPGPVKRPPKR
jgi:hypothetical protein